MEAQQGAQQQPDFIPVGATPDFIPAEEKPKPNSVFGGIGRRLKSMISAPPSSPLDYAVDAVPGLKEGIGLYQAEKQLGPQTWQKMRTAAQSHAAEPAWRRGIPNLQDVDAAVSGLSMLDPFATASVANINQLQSEDRGREAAGEGITDAALLAVGGAAPKVLPRVGPPIVRGVARGTNAALEKAPGLVGAAAGEGAGQIFGHPHVGGAIGYALGRDLLPRLRVPGERFGLPPVENRAMTPTGSAPAPEVPVESPAAPLKAKTLAGQNAEVLKRSGIAGPKATLKPLAEIPKGELTPDPHYDFQHVRSGEQAITQQISSHPLNKLRAIATQRGIKVAPSDTNSALIKKIADSATPAEIDAFEQARIERMHPNYAPAVRRPVTPAETRGIYIRDEPKPGFGTAKGSREERGYVPAPGEDLTSLLERSIRMSRKPR